MTEPSWFSCVSYYNGIPEVTSAPESRQYQPYLATYDSFTFYNTIGKRPGYFYRPIAAAKQVVNGTNYRFMTIAEPEQSDLMSHLATVEIYQPFKDRAYATKIAPA